ncbi:hypothetical protein PG988_016152 [Apiospora saccharicola]
MVGSYVSAYRLASVKLVNYLQKQFPNSTISVQVGKPHTHSGNYCGDADLRPASQKTEDDRFFVDAPEALTADQIQDIGGLREKRKRKYK